MDIDTIVKNIHEKAEVVESLADAYEETAKQIIQEATDAFSNSANETNEQDFEFFNAIMRYIQHDLNNNKEFLNLISMKQHIFINALEEHDMAFVQFNVVQEDQLRRQIDELQTSLSNREPLSKIYESLGDSLADYQEPYHRVLVEIRSLIESRFALQNALQGFNNDLEPIRAIIEMSISTGKLPRDLALSDITHVSVRTGDGLSHYINALPSQDSTISKTNRDRSLDVFLPQQLCHVRP